MNFQLGSGWLCKAHGVFYQTGDFSWSLSVATDVVALPVLHSRSQPGSLPTMGVPHMQRTLPSSSPRQGQMLKLAEKQTKEPFLWLSE